MAACRFHWFGDDGIAFRDLEGEFEVFVFLVIVEHGIGDEGAKTVVGEAGHCLEAFVVQSFCFEGTLHGVEEVAAVRKQVALVAFQGDERLRRGVEEGIRKTTQCELDGQSVMR